MIVLGPGWHTSEYVAALWGKHKRDVQRWCADGFLVSCGFKVVQLLDHTGNRKRYWIYGVDGDNSLAA